MYRMVFVIFLFYLSGCSRDVNMDLSPPHDSKLITVEVKNPSEYTMPFPLEIRYISYQCQKKRISGFNGSVITEPVYNVIQLPLQKRNNDTWIGEVAVNGGGSCKWSLSAINLGVEYIDANHLGKDLVPGTAVGASIAFDNDASRNGQYTSVQGDLTLSPKYYPYVLEWNIMRKKKELTLLGKEDFLSYRVFNLNAINYSPRLDETKVVRWIEPEKKVDGVYSRIVYPDGTVASEKTLFPDFYKVDNMKL